MEDEIRGEGQIQPPDSSIVATYAVSQGPGSTRTLIIAGNQGWLKRDTSMTPIPAELVVEERHQFYLYHLLQLLPLRAKGVKLAPVPPDSAGQEGFTVKTPGRLPVTLYFGADGAVARVVTTFAKIIDTVEETQEIDLSGKILANGVNWFRTMKIYRGGKPYFDLTLETLRVLTALDDPDLSGPKR